MECPVCNRHKATSYETLFSHVMSHKKADITTALLKLLELVDKKLSKLEEEVSQLKERVEEAKKP